jgi:hypothetical protein
MTRTPILPVPSTRLYTKRIYQPATRAWLMFGLLSALLILLFSLYMYETRIRPWLASQAQRSSAEGQVAQVLTATPPPGEAQAPPATPLPTSAPATVPAPPEPTATPASKLVPIPKEYTCPDLARVELQIGARGKIRKYDLNLRSEPVVPQVWDANILLALHDNDRVEVLDGPRCVYGGSWWMVRTETGVIGWSREMLPDKGRLIERIEE